MNATELNATARALVPEGKGILAADESHPSIARRFESVGVQNTDETRRIYRQMLFTTPGVADFISGVILFDETIRQKPPTMARRWGRSCPGRGSSPASRWTRGRSRSPGPPASTITEGLDGLRERLAEYRALGARFAKWRAVITIGPGLPTHRRLVANAHALARYAALCQEGGLVPIVEPEVLMDGEHTIERLRGDTRRRSTRSSDALDGQQRRARGHAAQAQHGALGQQCPRQAGVPEVARPLVRCFRRAVPAAVPGIVFLSGGQRDELATAHLNAMNAMAGPHPWPLSFSYGRALQAPALARGRAIQPGLPRASRPSTTARA